MASPEFVFGPEARQGAAQALESGISTQALEGEAPARPRGADPHAWGHLTKLEKIARGAFGEVYRAWDTLLERRVALKLYGTGEYQADESSQFGLREARLLARIRHPNVVTVYGVDRHEGQLGVWMEFIRGRTLEALLRELGPLAAREAALIGCDICSAVAATHELGFLHCDITTKNVMREDGGRIVLIDFGLNWDLRGASPHAVPRVCGTPLYMAPELLRGESSSVKSDVYSIGVLLYRLVSGRFPVEARNFSEIRAIHEAGDVKLLRDRRPNLPDAFLRAVERSLSLDAAARFSTIGQLAKALSAFLCVS